MSFLERPWLDLTIVLPAYNEAKMICSNVLETVTALSTSRYSYEVIVVDDGSIDGTCESALLAKREAPDHVRVIRYPVNRGKGHALLCGAFYARGRIVTFLDSDMDLRPEQLPDHLALLKDRDLDIVVGSKLHPLSVVDYPKWRRLLSYAYYLIVRSFFGLPIRDTQTGMKSFRREVLERVAPFSRMEKFAFDVELLSFAHKFGFKIGDAPVRLQFQRGTFGRIRFGDVQRIFTDTLKIFVRLKSFRDNERESLAQHKRSYGEELTIAFAKTAETQRFEGFIAGNPVA